MAKSHLVKSDEGKREDVKEETTEIASGSATKMKEEDKRQHLNNEIDFVRILNDTEKRTTVMIRNLPNKFK